ncbi:hypothetical protein QBC33DRAFT_524217 [Phialemonium atrogriseum]|uniref:SAP domain-containing protein n=1 Tax=Phialemonium atrogriseum TaxID=1093897 RepID=A0AAJ0CAB5_9PEZI|nr:uncharacterized protein QBC33DRAFT_524217 [Phialemonium atrogriseum]KAK1771622.1 hypothetical protein QBC33DRAFT_524217 [Phialemonium atrogriseum]
MATDWSKLTVVELRAELKRRGLPQTGKKADIVERLASADAEEENKDDAGIEEAPGGEEETTVEEAAVPDSVSELKPKTDSDSTRQPSAEIEQPEKAIPPPTSPQKPDVASSTQIPPEESTPIVEATTPSQQVVTTSTKNVEKEPSYVDTPPAPSEVVKDTRARKRRSRSPPLSAEEDVRKRVRRDDEDTHMAETDGLAQANGVAPEEPKVLPLTKEQLDEQPSFAEVKSVEAIEQGIEQQPPHAAEHARPDVDMDVDETEALKTQNIADASQSPRDLHHPVDHDTADDNVTGYGAVNSSSGLDEKAVVPAIHPATSALYIKNFMRPLRSAMVQEHLVQLATPPGSRSDPSVIHEFYLDQIRTHAYVSLSSVSAAARVRSALHDTIWPDERNRKPLWVDFIPAEKVVEWAEREQSDKDGRGNLNRWEVLYEPDDEGNMVAKLEEVGADSARQTARPPPPPVAGFIPTGPSRSNIGIEGAPLGPRGAGGRTGPNRGQVPATLGEGWKATRAMPSLHYRAAPEDLARRRLGNMRSYCSTERNRDMGREDEINRYTFEDETSFVDRGKEVFIGIRPPHRERDRRRRGGAAFGGPPRGPPRGPPPGGPPPFRPRPGSDRYFGGGGGGGSRRDDVGPRSRLDGAPLPTFGGRSDRRGRDDHRGSRY